MRTRWTNRSVVLLLILLGVGEVRGELIKRGGGDSPKDPAPSEESTDCDCDDDEDEKGPWSGSVSLGLSASLGEDKVATLSADIRSLYDARPHRVETVLTGFYSVENGNNKANRQYGRSEYRYYLMDRLYVFGGSSAERNLQQNLRFRSTTSAGPGYQLVERDRPDALIVKKDRASIQLGAGYQYQRLSTPGDRQVDQSFVFQVSGDYSLTFPHEIAWSSRLDFTVPPGDVDIWRFLGDTTLNVPVIGTLGLQARLTLDYLNGPELEARGGRKLTFFGSLGVSYSY